jgi:hypothetical protein
LLETRRSRRFNTSLRIDSQIYNNEAQIRI